MDEEETLREGPEAEEQAAGSDEPEDKGEGSAPKAEVSAESDPIVIEEEPSGRGFLSKLNPRRWFRGGSVDNFIKEGRELMESQSYAQAMVAFKRALSMEPNSAAAFRGLGKIHYKKGGKSNFKTALNYYQEAIKRKPMDHDLYAISAKIYDAMGQRKEATLERKKFVIVRALDADAKNPIANNNMGILFLQQGKADTALTYFQKAIDSDSNYDVAYRNLAAVYMRMAKESEDSDKKNNLNLKAKEAIKKSVDIAATPAALIAYARIMLKEGNFEEVLSLAERVDEMDPASKHVFQLKKMAFEALGRFEEAKNAHESYLVFGGADTGAPPSGADEED